MTLLHAPFLLIAANLFLVTQIPHSINSDSELDSEELDQSFVVSLPSSLGIRHIQPSPIRYTECFSSKLS